MEKKKRINDLPKFNPDVFTIPEKTIDEEILNILFSKKGDIESYSLESNCHEIKLVIKKQPSEKKS